MIDMESGKTPSRLYYVNHLWLTSKISPGKGWALLWFPQFPVILFRILLLKQLQHYLRKKNNNKYGENKSMGRRRKRLSVKTQHTAGECLRNLPLQSAPRQYSFCIKEYVPVARPPRCGPYNHHRKFSRLALLLKIKCIGASLANDLNNAELFPDFFLPPSSP